MPATVDDMQSEIERLVALGGTRIGRNMDEDGDAWMVMADPEGNEFCVA